MDWDGRVSGSDRTDRVAVAGRDLNAHSPARPKCHFQPTCTLGALLKNGKWKKKMEMGSARGVEMARGFFTPIVSPSRLQKL